MGMLADAARAQRRCKDMRARIVEQQERAGGLGIAIISTSTGLLTDRQAAKKKVGGEVLVYVW
jgi:small subunit ribosomal protein S8